MTINKQAIVRMAALLTLAAASTSALAQSTEYRRGYEAGFAAGQRAAYQGREDRGDWPRVHIEDADYGARGAMCDARRAVHEQAEHNNGAVHADNQLCGDPAPGTPKYLRIVYRCNDSAPMRVVLREGETMRLSCRR